MFTWIIGMSKKLISALFILFGLFLSGYSFAYMEDKLYCNLKSSAVLISLQKSDGYKCNVYITEVEKMMKKTYNDIQIIKKYLDKKQDISFWKPIKEKKEWEFNKLTNMRYLIVDKMTEFESNLLTKYKGYFKKKNLVYQMKIESSFSKIVSLSWTIHYTETVKKMTNLFDMQIGIMQKIDEAKDFNELMKFISSYVYLRQQIEWK